MEPKRSPLSMTMSHYIIPIRQLSPANVNWKTCVHIIHHLRGLYRIAMHSSFSLLSTYNVCCCKSIMKYVYLSLYRVRRHGKVHCIYIFHFFVYEVFVFIQSNTSWVKYTVFIYFSFCVHQVFVFIQSKTPWQSTIYTFITRQLRFHLTEAHVYRGSLL